MHHQTQIEAWQKINNDGLLKGLQLAVFTLVYESGTITQGEALKRYDDEIGCNNSGSVSTRFSELERMGVIESVGTRACKVTGNNCLEYAITGRLPVKPEKKKPRSELKQEIEENVERIAVKFNDWASVSIINPELSRIKDLLNQL